MSYETDIEIFKAKLQRAREHLLHNCAVRVHRSITEGDPSTGSPGVPVLTGALKGSWRVIERDGVIEISTDSPYAPKIEFSRGSSKRLAMTLTRANWERIVYEEAAKFR